MDDSLFVRVVQSTSRLHDAVYRFGNRQRTALLHLTGQVAAIDELHDKEMPHLGLVRVVGHDDVGMAQTRDRLDFALKPLHELLGLADASRQYLDGHHTLHAPMAGLVHRSHGAGAQAVQHLIVADKEFLEPPFAHGVGLKASQLPSANQTLRQRITLQPRLAQGFDKSGELFLREKRTVNQVLEKIFL